MTNAKPLWLSDGREKRERVKELFADLAPVYDRLNRSISLSLDDRWRRFAVRELGLDPGATVLDICAGTGAFLIPLRKAVGELGFVVGVDFCRPMLERAKDKEALCELAVSDACDLPLAGDSFDAATIGWGLRNVADLRKALAEAFRVLKPGGRLANVDMARPRWAPLRAASERLLTPILRARGGRDGKSEAYAYLAESSQRFLSRTEFSAAMAEVGFQQIRYRDFALGHVCLHVATKPS